MALAEAAMAAAGGGWCSAMAAVGGGPCRALAAGPQGGAGAGLKASRPLIRVLVINDNGLWINDFI